MLLSPGSRSVPSRFRAGWMVRSVVNVSANVETPRLILTRAGKDLEHDDGFVVEVLDAALKGGEFLVDRIHHPRGCIFEWAVDDLGQPLSREHLFFVVERIHNAVAEKDDRVARPGG